MTGVFRPSINNKVTCQNCQIVGLVLQKPTWYLKRSRKHQIFKLQSWKRIWKNVGNRIWKCYKAKSPGAAFDVTEEQWNPDGGCNAPPHLDARISLQCHFREHQPVLFDAFIFFVFLQSSAACFSTTDRDGAPEYIPYSARLPSLVWSGCRTEWYIRRNPAHFLSSPRDGLHEIKPART